MTSLLPIFLVLNGGAFLVWALLAFRWLFALRADAVALSGRAFPNMATQLRAFRAGLRAPRYRRHRIGMLLATAVLIPLSGLTALALD